MKKSSRQTYINTQSASPLSIARGILIEEMAGLYSKNDNPALIAMARYDAQKFVDSLSGQQVYQQLEARGYRIQSGKGWIRR